MWFEQPLLLVGLVIIPGVYYLRRYLGWGKPASIFYPEIPAVKAAFKGGRRPGSGWREIIQLSLMALLILAAARPHVAAPVELRQTSGLDIMLALDISGSMSARDFDELNRLQAAKEVLRQFLARAKQDRIGLVAFAARAYHVCPLTVDYQVLNLLLDHLQIGMTTDGTAIGMAITSAVNRLKESSAKSKVIILLTDGKNNTGQLDPVTAAQLAAALNIKIYTIGIGREGGAPIMVKDVSGEEHLLLDADGSIHFEEVAEAPLMEIASLTGGNYYRANDKKSLIKIYNEIGRLERVKLETKRFTSKQDIGWWFLLAVLLLFLIDQLLGLTTERRLP